MIVVKNNIHWSDINTDDVPIKISTHKISVFALKLEARFHRDKKNMSKNINPIRPE